VGTLPLPTDIGALEIASEAHPNIRRRAYHGVERKQPPTLASVATPSENPKSIWGKLKAIPITEQQLDLKPEQLIATTARNATKTAPAGSRKHERAVSHVQSHIARGSNYIKPLET